MMRCTCTSTQIPGLLNARLVTRFAVFLPTPGRVVSSSIVPGSFELNFSTRIFAECLMCFDFVL